MIGIVVLAVLNGLAFSRIWRWDLTDDRRYSLSPASKELLARTDAPIEVTLLLNGDIGSDFNRLRRATIETLDEMRVYAHGLNIRYVNVEEADTALLLYMQRQRMVPTIYTKQEHSGKTVEMRMWPYAIISYHGDSAVVSLFGGTGRNAGEVLNASIEQLEYQFMEPLHLMQRTQVPRIAILEGHDEPYEAYTADLEQTLSRYYQVFRGSINGQGVDVHILDDFAAVIVANPQSKFGDQERYVLDQYIMRGGSVLWAVDGVQFSNDMLRENGYTPIIAHDVGIQDMLFRYGIRIEPALVQDVQCLTIPVQTTGGSEQSQVQIPWTYAPLLQPNPYHPISRNLGTLMSTFVSPISAVNVEDSIDKIVLAYTSTNTKLTAVPNEVNLNETNPDWNTFDRAQVPIAVAMEGAFNSAYAHRMMPEGVLSNEPIRKKGEHAKQVVIGTGSILMNEATQRQVFPMGYDRYTDRLYSNRDFIVHSALWLTDSEGLIQLRGKIVPLRQLNTKRAYEQRTKIELVSTISPIVLLALVGAFVFIIRKRRYEK